MRSNRSSPHSRLMPPSFTTSPKTPFSVESATSLSSELSSVIPNTASAVGILHFHACLKPQEAFQQPPFPLIRDLGVLLPASNRLFRNSRILSQFGWGQFLLNALDLDEVAKRFGSCWEGLPGASFARNMPPRNDDLAICNSQQGYSPQGRGRTISRHVAYQSAPFFPRRSSSLPLPWGEGGVRGNAAEANP